jgi:hypothetical protein
MCIYFQFVTDLDNLLLPGKIEEVGVPLLEYFLDEVKDVFVFLYDEDDVRSTKLLKGLEEVCVFKHEKYSLLYTSKYSSS